MNTTPTPTAQDNLRTRHTPEPWIVRTHPDLGSFVEKPRQVGQPYGIEILGDEDYQTKEADCYRIVACVNACAGMADPAKEFEVMRNQLNALRWIPITERLPTIEDGDQFEDVEWSDGKDIWQGNYLQIPSLHNATHWRRITLP